MDGGRFDGLTKILTGAGEPASRRRALSVLASGALCAALGRLGRQDAAAACKQRAPVAPRASSVVARTAVRTKGLHQGACIAKTSRCCSFGGFCTDNRVCCAPNSHEPFGTCCPADGPNCCLPEVKDAGHAGCCSVGFPVCCPPIPEQPDFPNGYCCRRGATCCAAGCCPVSATAAANASDLTKATPGRKARPTVQR